MKLQGKCPTGCGRIPEAGKLMCRPCWANVPRDIQARVYSTWRRCGHGTPDARRVARYDYDEAREAALASVA